MKRPNYFEPDDGYIWEKENGYHKTWQEWEDERDAWMQDNFPGLLEVVGEVEVKNGKRS